MSKIMIRIGLPFLAGLICLLFLSSCYSIRIASKEGVPEPSVLGTDEVGFYADKAFTVLDTTIKLKIYENDAMFIESCDSDGLYSVEYRIRFIDLIWNALTFGTQKKVRVKYVCLKPE